MSSDLLPGMRVGQTIKTVLGDAERALKQLKLRDIGLIVTDPPYGKEFKSNRVEGAEIITGDGDQTKIDDILALAWAKLQPHRHAYIFGPSREIPNAGIAEIVWDKKYPASAAQIEPWARSHEPVTMYAHRYPSEPTAGEAILRLRRNSVVRVAALRGHDKRTHPNQKPIELLRHLIEASSLPGDLVVDPFMGSGATGVAAILSGRRFFGVEILPEFYDRAVTRLLEVQTFVGRVGK